FSINWDRVIRPVAPYWRLLQMANVTGDEVDLLSRQFWRDLAASFNLAWIDPEIVEGDPQLRALRDQGSGYSQADVRAIIDKHYEITAQIVPFFRQLEATGQVELTTSPYYHPILPLLVDNNVARVASPHLALPEAAVYWPEDAAEQLRRARVRHEQLFGRAPRGLWPSEGAVSPAVEGLLKGRQAFQWLATDEAILARSQNAWFDRDGHGHVCDPQRLYQPYLSPEGNLTLVFRDRVLSDRIGFVYQQMEARAAADDLVGRLHAIQERLNDPENPYLVSIVLDGENCWEGYANNGNDFLRALYERLSHDDRLSTVTVGEYLDRFPARRRLSNLFSGSWINHNLETWIGEPEQNRAWEYLARTRARLVAWQNTYALADEGTLAAAWEQLYTAEGSDWFWWYYSHNKLPTGQERLFDVEFRQHLSNVYALIGQPVPSWLHEPIASALPHSLQRAISARISPQLRGEAEASSEWDGAGYLEPASSTGSMQVGGTALRRLYFGYSETALFLRVEGRQDLSAFGLQFYLATPGQRGGVSQPRFVAVGGEFAPPEIAFGYEISVVPGATSALLSLGLGGDAWQVCDSVSTMAAGPRVVELSIALAELGLREGDEVGLLLTVVRQNVLIEALPRTGYVSFSLRLRRAAEEVP
ncbi:MAG: hypothetical protein ACYC4L_19045, partial [Chloroflexota bacterium]